MSYNDCRAPRPSQSMPDTPDNVLEQFNMNGKVCIVTGGSRGIGAAISEGLAEAGAHIVIVHTSNNPSVSQRAHTLSERCGVNVVSVQCDVTDALEVGAMISRVQSDFGKIDVFIANAGVCDPKPLLEETLESYHAQMDVNLHGVVYCAKAVGPVFRDQGFGNFIITTSVSGSVVTVPIDHTTYNTSKAAALHLGRSLAREWREFARVNMVSPGWIDTDMSTDLPSVNEARRMAILGRLGRIYFGLTIHSQGR